LVLLTDQSREEKYAKERKGSQHLQDHLKKKKAEAHVEEMNEEPMGRRKLSA